MAYFGADMKATVSILTLTLALAASSVFAGPPGPPPKPCGTSGSLQATPISPALYAYTIGEAGGVNLSFTVSSPGILLNGGCDSSLPYVFGNGNGADPSVLPFTPSVTSIEVGGVAVDAATDAALRAALSAFASVPFQLSPPGSGSQSVSFSFTNSAAVPAGSYDVTIGVQPEPGAGVGAVARTFTIQVEEPQVLDTVAPTVNIVSPVTQGLFKLNENVLFSFTALDPPEGGAGTGVTAVRAQVSSCAGAYTFDLTSGLSVAPPLPVPADTTVTASSEVNSLWLGIGTFALNAEADDAAGHTGSATATFTVGANIAPLPPISVPNRQFNAGSTVPIKFAITDATGAFLPPMEGLIVRIVAPSGAVEDRVPGDGAGNVRWELDAFGNATQYITNHPIPVTGTYQVQVLVSDVCSTPAQQGAFTFVAASKGGKQ
jgi:hypothetical protein